MTFQCAIAMIRGGLAGGWQAAKEDLSNPREWAKLSVLAVVLPYYFSGPTVAVIAVLGGCFLAFYIFVRFVKWVAR